MDDDNEDQEREEQPVVVKLDQPKALDFEYPEDYKEKQIVDSDMPNKLSSLYEIIGQDANRRYNYFFLNEKEILLSIANTFQIFDIETKERKILFTTEVGGVGAIAVHPSKAFYAIGECGQFPNIYINKYEEGKTKLFRILRRGTEKAFSALSFIEKGDLLSSVGCDPDYNLVIWNWKTETMILKAKAFSQEVYRVQFSDNFEGKLITSGMGHIRFWEMAKTFTGLKLQGDLGKFGQVDLSDISSFVEFPDGKVLCGTEHGTFLLWEGIFIKANLKGEDNSKIHEGLVEHMSWDLATINEDDTSKLQIISAGHDGYIKWWKYLDIENVVLDDDSNGIILPVRLVQLINPISNKPMKIMNLVKEKDFWLIQDGNGYLVKVNMNDEFKSTIICDFHSGPIVKVEFFPNLPVIFTQGSDKRISISAFASNMKRFPQKILLDDESDNTGIFPTSCDMSHREANDDQLIAVVGYSNGMVKVFCFDSIDKKLQVIFQTRPHEEGITKLKFSPDMSYLVTSTKKEMFFFIVEKYDKIVPWCCIKMDELQIVDIDWHIDSKKVLVGYTNGTLEEIEIPLHFDNTKSFILTEYNKQTFKIKLAENQIEKVDEKKRQRQKEQGKLKEEPEPGSIFSCKYIGLYQEDDFLVTSQKPYSEFLYLCTFNMSESNKEQRPVNFWKLPLNTDCFVKHISKSYIFLATQYGSVQIRNKKLIDKYVEIFPNVTGNQVTDISTSQNEQFVCVAFSDGTCVVYSIDNEGLKLNIELLTSGITDEKQKELNKRVVDQPSFEFQDLASIIKDIKPSEFSHLSSDVQPSQILSLENDKQEAQEREKERIANEKRQKLITKLDKLRDEFKKLLSMNTKLPEEIRLSSEELIVDYKYLEIVAKDKQSRIEDVENKYSWLKANVNVTINKIETFFLSSVHTNKSVVLSFRTNDYVSTLRTPTLPLNFEKQLKEINSDIEEFQKKIAFDSLDLKYKPFIDTNEINEEDEKKKFESLIQLGDQRNVSQKNKKGNQLAIKEEIEETKIDTKVIREFLESKISIKTQMNLREEGSKKGQDVYSRHKAIIRCPEVYHLKTKFDKVYNESTMITNTMHKRKIYAYLKLIYEERDKFNLRVLNLKEKKVELMAKLNEYKVSINEINKTLKINETYDWLTFTNKDSTQDLEKIPEEELTVYMKKRIEKDKELQSIYGNELMDNDPSHQKEDDDWGFVVRERPNKQVNQTELDIEYTKLIQQKNNYKKEQKLKEVNEMIDSFDNEVNELKNERTVIAFYQKVGEYELMIKQKEMNKLRAFEREDRKICDKTGKLFDEYNENLQKLQNNHTYLENCKDELLGYEKRKKEKEDEFEKLIENERENREQLTKIFRQRKKEPSKDPNGDDKMDQEEELNIPKSISTQLKNAIFQLRENREVLDEEIQRSKNKIDSTKRTIDNDIRGKEALDRKRRDLREKIEQNEKHKEQYINQIELSMIISFDQFLRINPSNGKLPIELGLAILITKEKLEKLDQDLKGILELNENFKIEENEFKKKSNMLLWKKKNLEKSFREIETTFKNEQILKFGLEIDFDFLLQASKDTTVDRYENEYLKLKIESDKKIDTCKRKIDEAKSLLQESTNNNTIQLKEIKKELKKKQANDKNLEEKNSEITKKNNKKFVMYDLKTKKKKLKVILKLLKQQMEALKKEIDIFKRKGGHIYSTIASNLV